MDMSRIEGFIGELHVAKADFNELFRVLVGER